MQQRGGAGRIPSWGSLRAAGPACTAVLLLLAVLGGCDRNKGMTVRQPWSGPTEPIDVVVERINQRNARIVSLRCEGDFAARLIDPQTKKVTTGDGTIQLMYMPQRNLRLRGRVLTEVIFDIGSNDDRYWMIIPREETMWWGNHRLIGHPRTRQLPVRPDLLVEVLSVGRIEPDLLREPVPVMRFNNDQHAYMFTWQVQLPDRWIVQKEVWYDRETLLPRLVLLFDANGRVVLRAYLSRPEPVEGYEPTVQMASRYDMFFPDSGSTFRIELKDLAHNRSGVPTPRSFNFPGDSANVAKVIQIDE